MLKSNEIPDKNKNGNCYESAFKLLEKFPEARLIHGLVNGRDILKGYKYIHAWIELNYVAMDTSNEQTICMSSEEYRKILQVEDTIQYTLKEARNKALEYRHYGYWDEELGSKETMSWAIKTTKLLD